MDKKNIGSISSLIARKDSLYLLDQKTRQSLVKSEVVFQQRKNPYSALERLRGQLSERRAQTSVNSTRINSF